MVIHFIDKRNEAWFHDMRRIYFSLWITGMGKNRVIFPVRLHEERYSKDESDDVIDESNVEYESKNIEMKYCALKINCTIRLKMSRLPRGVSNLYMV